MSLQLWEILVPRHIYGKTENDMLHHHMEWDALVHDMAGGLTILKPTKGQWVSDGVGVVVREDMIPVRIATDGWTMSKIAEFTKKHYKQDSVMYYQLSNEVHFI